MKYLMLLFAVSLFVPELKAQDLQGAWERSYRSESGDSLRQVVIFADGYQASAIYHATDGTFVETNGGGWLLDGNIMTEFIEFHSTKPELVNTEVTFEVRIAESEIEITDRNLVYHRIDDGTPGELQGAWLMSGRVRDGETQYRDTSQPRKTMKILSGTRFQWIAYHTEDRTFLGTGGGSYTTQNG